MREVTIAIDDTWTRERFYYKSPLIEAGEVSVVVRLDFFSDRGRKATEGLVSFALDPERYYTVEVEDFHREITPAEAVAELVDLANRIAPVFGLHLVAKEAGR